MHLYIYIIPQKAEDDIEHLLVVTLRIGIVAIGNGGEKLRRYQVTHQSGANFFIRNVERVNAKFAIAIFYSDIAALIKQRSDAGHALRGSVEFCGHGFHAAYLRRDHTELVSISIR